MIQILYETGEYGDKKTPFKFDPEHGVNTGVGEHEARARALGGATPGSQCGPIQIAGIQKPQLDTLVYWGHGTPARFCGMSPEEFVADVSKWKKWNRLLKTVELITCDARHAGLYDQSFTNAIRASLKKKYPDISIKAFPMGMGRFGPHTFSILLANTPTKTWCYITAGGKTDNDEMQPAQRKVEAEAKKQGGNLSLAGAAVEKNEPTREFGIKYGTFSTLRNALVAIA